MLPRNVFYAVPLVSKSTRCDCDILVLTIKTHPESPRMITFSSTFFLEVIFSALNTENMKMRHISDLEGKTIKSNRSVYSLLIVADGNTNAFFW